MEYKRYDLGNNRLHIIKTNKFKTINVKVNFKRLLKKEERTIRNFISQIILCSSKKYPTKRDLEIESEELYGVDISSKSYRSGNYSIISFSTTFLNEKYTEIGMNKNSFDFFKEVFLNPNIENNAFNEQDFILTRNLIEDDIKSTKDNPGRYSILRLYEETAPDSVLAYLPDGYIEDLEKINSSNLYNYYKDMLENDIVDIFVIGDVEFEDIRQNFNLQIGKGVSEIEKHFLNLEDTRNNVKIIKEKKDINQSKLAISLKFSDLTNFEKKYVLKLYNFILGGGGESKLFKSLRVDNSLCYYVSSTSSMLDGIITITSGIDKSEFEKAVDLVKKAIEEMQKGDFEVEEIQKGKITFINSCKYIYDSPIELINVYASKEYINNDLVTEKMENIKKVDKNMIISLANKVKMDTIFLLEGGNNNE